MQYAHHTDRELYALLKQDDRQAFHVIYERYWESLYRSACRLLRASAQAEDIVQDLFVNLWLKRAEYTIDDLGAYLRRALRNRVLNYVQRDQARASFFEPFETMLQASFSAEELVREKELLQVIAAYIDALPPKRREIFLMHYQERLNTEDIAALLGISRKTVQNQLNTTITGLRTAVTSFLLVLLAHSS